MSEGSEASRSAASVQVIARAADILRALQVEPAGLTQAELVERLGLAKSTLNRLLGALEEEGLVATAGARSRYRLGPEISRMAHAVRRSLVVELHPLLEELSLAVQETVDLSVLDGSQMRFVDQVVAPHRLRAVSAIGETFPMYCTANGKAVLAALPASQAARLIPPHPRARTPKTLTTVHLIQQELAIVREDGVAFDREEHTDGICAIGLALGELAGEMTAISVPLPATRFYGHEDELRTTIVGVVAGRRPVAALTPV